MRLTEWEEQIDAAARASRARPAPANPRLQCVACNAVFAPADGVDTAAIWAAHVKAAHAPSRAELDAAEIDPRTRVRGMPPSVFGPLNLDALPSTYPRLSLRRNYVALKGTPNA